MPEEEPTASFSNPIVSGFAPDPSIARVGDDFYLVTSTFEYFPYRPVSASRDGWYRRQRDDEIND